MASSWLLRQVASSPYLKTMASIVIREPPTSLFLPRFFLSSSFSSSSKKHDSSIKSSPPWLMLTPEIKLSSGTDTVFKFYSLAEDKVISVDRRNLKVQLGLESEEGVDLECRGSSHGWLVLLDRWSSDLFLYNPLSNRHLKLPSIRKLKAFRKDPLEDWHLRVKKVIISSSDPEGDANCRALMIHGDKDKLAFCCPKSSDEWFETSHRYKDIVCSGDNSMLFFGIRPYYPEFEGWDLKDVSRPKLIYLKKSSWRRCQDANFLVAAANKMYYVCLDGGDLSYVNEEGDYRFHVHEFDFESGKLVRMDGSIDGLALFVGRNHSFALPAAEFLEPNTIYFTHPHTGLTRRERESFGRKYIKAYNYQDGTFSPAPLYTFTGDSYFCLNPPMWYTPTCALV